MKRRTFIRDTGLFVASSAAMASGVPTIGKKQPNILLIVTDQESRMTPEMMNQLDLPARRWLAERGTSFSRFFCVTPQCTPARSTLQTGLYPHQTRHVSNTNKPYCAPIPEGTEFLGTQLWKAGYQNGYGGKWHLLENKKRLGVGKITGYTNDAEQAEDFRTFIQEKKLNKPWFYQAHYLNPHDIYHFNMLCEGAPLPAPDNDYARDMIRRTEQQREVFPAFIEKYKDLVSLPAGWDQPIQGIPAPVGDWAYPFENSGKYQTLTHAEKETYWKNYKLLYYMLHEIVDRQIGDLLDVLRRDHPKELENTVIIFTADHGDLSGTHESLKYKGPLPYDPQMHIPLIISGPGIPENQECSQLASQIDLPATICELAGAVAPNPGRADARSLLPAIQQTSTTHRDFVFTEYYFLGAVQPLRIIRSKDWKYAVHYAENKKALFNLDEDPYERNNLAGMSQYAEIEQKLHNALVQWQQQTEDPVTTEHFRIPEWVNPRQEG